MTGAPAPARRRLSLSGGRLRVSDPADRLHRSPHSLPLGRMPRLLARAAGLLAPMLLAHALAAQTLPPPDWYLRDPATDGVAGAAVRRALRDALAGQQPKRTVLVAVIDGGVDTAHAALRAALWRNPGEVPGNGRDDDGDGYADDVRGWNFLGAPNGRNVGFLQFEITRIAARCRAGGRPGAGVAFSCDSAARLYEATHAAAVNRAARFDRFIARRDSARTLLARVLGVPRDSLTRVRAAALPGGPDPAPGDSVGRARALVVDVDLSDAQVRDARADLARRATVGYDLAADPRAAVLGDVRGQGRRYGNGDVAGTDPRHGTAVSGLIAGAPGDSGVAGVAPFARILAVRAVTTGDERDEDVANAIRYAVDRGAQIINMSFGKLYSPEKPVVDSAVRYAAARGVLMVHAAANEGSDNDRAPEYPTPGYVGGGRAATWLDVGASGPVVGPDLAAYFSNYGRTSVDLFAPGVEMFVAHPGGRYERGQGTSYAAPVVSGVAALLMAYFPALTAADVRRILIASATPYREVMVTLPGTEKQQVPFGTLSVAGGVVNAYEAVRMAQREAAAGRAATP